MLLFLLPHSRSQLFTVAQLQPLLFTKHISLKWSTTARDLQPPRLQAQLVLCDPAHAMAGLHNSQVLLNHYCTRQVCT
jgi:hypothetical protein